MLSSSRIKAGGEIHLDARVCGFNRLASPQEGFSLAFESDEGSSTHATDFDAVIMALPADRAAELVWPLDSMLGGTLGEIEYASSAIVCTGHALADVARSAQRLGPRHAGRREAADPLGFVRQPQIRRPRA